MADYNLISAMDPALCQERRAGRPLAVFAGQLFVPQSLDIPPLFVGDTDFTAATIVQSPPSSAFETRLEFPGTMDLRLFDATVHAPYGIVTVGDYVISETYYPHFSVFGYQPDGDRVRFPAPATKLDLPAGLAAFSVSHANYFHFMMEIVPRLQVSPLSDRARGGFVLLPQRLDGPQLELVGILGRADVPMILCEAPMSVRFEELYLPAEIIHDHFRPHPSLKKTFDTLGSLLGVNETPRRKIYVSRRDSGSRRLSNEDEVIHLVEKYGFEVVELTGLTWRQQASVFASASHIMAPHGAGLTNIVFCRDDVVLCELQMDVYVNWLFRRLGGLRRARYGCLVGETDGGTPVLPATDIRTLCWTIDLGKVESVLTDPSFIS